MNVIDRGPILSDRPHMAIALDTRLDGKLADLERRVTVRMLAGIAAVSALVKLL